MIGSHPNPDGTTSFRVWAPHAKRVELDCGEDASPRYLEMSPSERGYFELTVDSMPPGSRYRYRLDGDPAFPDPASRSQPDGVHGPSAVVDPGWSWSDAGWTGIALSSYVIYELHVGTFTPEGTFDAVIPHLAPLRELGITAIELMPVAQFPGDRNWGYDGVYPFSVQSSYGGPEGLQRLVDACHREGLAAILDVVYNHLGPEGNYLEQFGPYFTDRHRTPWGKAVNFDGPASDEVRHYFIENALQWVGAFHFDALRLDAVHAIPDQSALPFLQELARAVHRFGEESSRRVHLFAESDLNDPRLIRSEERGGYGLDAQWSDDFHHALHALVTGERDGYYADFGEVGDLAAAMRDSFVYAGRYSRYRDRRYGAPVGDQPGERFVVSSQNHDQVGNRMLGERLSALVPFEALKLVAGVVLLAPCLPLLFMGEEYGETAPFLYFVSHGDPDLVEAVREGRKKEFRSFEWQAAAPDPFDRETFERSKLDWALADRGHHAVLRRWYATLLSMRREHPALRSLDREGVEVSEPVAGRVLLIHRRDETDRAAALIVCNVSDERVTLPRDAIPPGPWAKRLDSLSPEWQTPAAPAPAAPDALAPGAAVDLAPYALLLYT